MESSDPQQTKVDFYEAEYDKAYEKKTTLTAYKPTIAGLLLFIPAMIFYVGLLLSLLLEYSGWWDILAFIILSVIEITIIYAGYCALKKERHRFVLLGAILSFIIPMNYSVILMALVTVFGDINNMVILGLLVFHPFVVIYLIITSDDEFSS